MQQREKDLSEWQRRAANFERQTIEMGTKIDKLEGRLAQKDFELKKTKQENKQTAKQHDFLKQEFEKTQKELKQSNTLQEKVADLLSRSDAKNQSLTSELKSMKKRSKQIDKELKKQYQGELDQHIAQREAKYEKEVATMQQMFKDQHQQILEATKKSVQEQVAANDTLRAQLQKLRDGKRLLEAQKEELVKKLQTRDNQLNSLRLELSTVKDKAEEVSTKLTKQKVQLTIELEELTEQYAELSDEIHHYRSMILGEEERMNKKRKLQVPTETLKSNFDLKTFDMNKGELIIENTSSQPESLKGWYLANQDRTVTFWLPAIKLEPFTTIRILIGENQTKKRPTDVCWLADPWDGRKRNAIQLLDRDNQVRSTIKVHEDMLSSKEDKNCIIS